MNRTVLTLRICGWSSLGMGLIFFLIPGWYAELEGATTENIAWLRNLGAGGLPSNEKMTGAFNTSSYPCPTTMGHGR